VKAFARARVRGCLQFIHYFRPTLQATCPFGGALPAADAYKARESAMALTSRKRSVFRFTLVQLLASALWLSLMIAATPLAAADVTVIMDQARLIRLPDRVATIVIGNPMIADASLQPGGMMVLTGKGYGMTNLVVLDRAGNVLMERSVEVKGPRTDVVVMYRGIDRETYSCTPICQRQIMLGDSSVYFDAGVLQTGGRNSLAQGAAPAAK
jgi:Pilus formation protein N terminal region